MKKNNELDIKIVKIDPQMNNKDPLKSKYKYTKIVIENPYNNRKLIARIAKRQKGVYLF